MINSGGRDRVMEYLNRSSCPGIKTILRAAASHSFRDEPLIFCRGVYIPRRLYFTMSYTGAK